MVDVRAILNPEEMGCGNSTNSYKIQVPGANLEGKEPSSEHSG